MTVQPPPSTAPARNAAIALALAALVAITYLPVGSHPFIGFDDPTYVTANPVVREGLTTKGIAWAFSSTEGANWHPVTWMSHMADVEMFGLDAGRHHLTSLSIHLANTLLLFALLLRMTGAPWRSALAAALFGIHPLHVESVAWISERKDVLSAFFLFMTIFAYLRYTERPGPSRYLVVPALLAVGLMTKPMLVTVPFLLLLLDRWPLKRFSIPGGGSAAGAGSDETSGLGRCLLEKLPLLALSVLSAVATCLAAARGGALRPLDDGPFTAPARLGNAVVSIATYLWKTAWPAGLAPFYPFPKGGGSVSAIIISCVLLSTVTAAVIRWGRRNPALPVGWLWFLAALLPVLGIVQVGDQAMADRYVYLPHVGLFLALAWAIPEPGGRTGRLRLLPVITCVAAVLALAVVSRHQLSYWRSDRNLFGHALEVTSPGWTPPRVDDAAVAPPRSFDPRLAGELRSNPNFERACFSLGEAYKLEGRFDEALLVYREALQVDPSLKMIHNNLAGILLSRGRTDEAAAHYREAIRLDPGLMEPHFNLGTILARQGAWGEAAFHYREAVRLRPGNAEGHFNLAEVVRLGGKPAEALPHYREALRLAPGDQLAAEGFRKAERAADHQANAGRVDIK